MSGAGRDGWRVRCHVLPDRSAERAARAAVKGHDPDGAVHGAVGAGVLRAAELRPIDQVVPRPGHRRQVLRPDHAHQEPRSAPRSRDRRPLLRRRRQARPAAALRVERALLGDRTLLQAWASHKSFKLKDGSGDGPAGPGRNAKVQWHGQKRSNQTHVSMTDPESRPFRKSHTAAMLCHSGHLLMENRNALIVTPVRVPRSLMRRAGSVPGAGGHGHRPNQGSSSAGQVLVAPRADLAGRPIASRGVAEVGR